MSFYVAIVIVNYLSEKSLKYSKQMNTIISHDLIEILLRPRKFQFQRKARIVFCLLKLIFQQYNFSKKAVLNKRT